MSVSATASSASFNGDGVSTVFPVPFRVLEDDDLLVEVSIDGGQTYEALVLDDDYELDGAGPDDGTGTAEGVTLTLTGYGALLAQAQLRVQRNTDPTQETTFQPQGQFSPIVHSRMVDKLTLLVQELVRRVTVLEALADLVTVTELADAVSVQEELDTSSVDAIEDFFPLEVACAGGQNATYAIFRVWKDGDEDVPFDEPPVVQWRPGPLNKITIVRISGLEPGQLYQLTGLVFFS